MTMKGTPRNDVIRDDTGDDYSLTRISGFAGDDRLYGLRGKDWIDGGTGNDTIHGGEGWDTIVSGAGDDVMTGGAGTDMLRIRADTGTYRIDLSTTQRQDTGMGRDVISGFEVVKVFGAASVWVRGSAAAMETLIGGTGNDTLIGGGDNDFLIGGAGNDLLFGSSRYSLFDHQIDGGIGIDTLRGDGGNDHFDGSNADGVEVIEGMGGNDDISGGAPGQTLRGGEGNDTLSLFDNGSIVDGGSGHDTIRLHGTQPATTPIRLNSTAMQNVDGSLVSLRNIEGVEAYISGDHWVIGNDSNNRLIGFYGNDTFAGGNGNDFLDGSYDDDLLHGQSGNDVLLGRHGNDRLDGGDGTDTINGGRGIDTMKGGKAADQFVFSTGDSGTGKSRDRIYDFQRGVDDIDLRGIDADTGRAGDQAFANGGTTPRAHAIWTAQAGDTTLIRGDVNGDGTFDFEIQVNGTARIAVGDFLL